MNYLERWHELNKAIDETVRIHALPDSTWDEDEIQHLRSTQEAIVLALQAMRDYLIPASSAL